MIDAIEGTQGYSEPRLSSALAQVTSRRVFDGLNDESASPWAAVSLAAALFVSCFHTGGIRRLISFRDSWCEADFSISIRNTLGPGLFADLVSDYATYQDLRSTGRGLSWNL